MGAPSRIATFLRNTRPNAYCEHCLSTALGIERRTVGREMALLGHQRDFEQARGVCSLCGSVQPLIAAAAPNG